MSTPHLVVLITTLWLLRFTFNSHAAYNDARAVVTVFCVLNRDALISYISHSLLQWHITGSVLAWLCAIALVLWFAMRMLRRDDSVQDASCKQDDTTLLRPCMIPCRTTHARMFPTKHSFSYSYLYVGIPVGWQGPAGSILSVEKDARSIQANAFAKTWFTVAAEDYLERGIHEHGLRAKLRDYLQSQDVSPEKYPYAYLVTAPRFLGFSFNPVSFWYLYDDKRCLRAMILEVNNTFDERRMYYMERKADSSDSQDLGVKFVQEWPKDFHVSPFNDRGGAYSVQSTDPFHHSADGLYRIDNNIVLKNEENRPKLIARVFSTESAIDVSTITAWKTITFVLRWWWVGFMTNPRIVKEARALWTKKLQVYYRPEVFSSSIGRHESSDEVKLELFFRSFLEQMASTEHINFRYTGAAGSSRSKLSEIRLALDNKNDGNEYPMIELRILTPAFYSQLVRYSTFQEACDRHCFKAADGDVMLQCTQPEIFQQHLLKFSVSLQRSTGSSAWHVKLLNFGQVLTLGALWQTLLATLRSGKLSEDHGNVSEFDLCVVRGSSPDQTQLYHRIAAKLLLADRIAFGWMPVLKLEELCVWLLLILAATSASRDLLGFERHGPGGILLILLKLCGIHIWSAVLYKKCSDI